MAQRVFVLGSSGMAGHVIALTLGSIPGVKVTDVGPRKKVFNTTCVLDMRDELAIDALLKETDPQFVVNCVGVLTEAAENNRLDAIWLNAYLPNLLSTLCARDSRKLIHLSTDCVFSGHGGPYRERDFRDGDSVYDRTKALGEIANGDALTIRTSIVGPELNPNGVGLFHWFMAQEKSINGYSRALWSGVTTVQLAAFVAWVITDRPSLSGLVHYAVAGGISKLELLRLFNEVFRRGLAIEPVEVPAVDKRLVNTRGDFSCLPPSYAEQVGEMKGWIDRHPGLYTHYGAGDREDRQ